MSNKIRLALSLFVAPEAGHFLVPLARILADRGCLPQILVLSRGRTNDPQVFIEPLPGLELLQKIVSRLHVPYHINRGLMERLFDLASPRLLDPATDLLIAGHPVIPRTLRQAKRLGITTALLAANPYDPLLTRITAEEGAKWGVRQRDFYASQFRLAEMRRSLPYLDYLLATTSVIAQTYRESGFSGKIVEFSYPYGLNLQQFSMPETKQNQAFRVGYLGHSYLLKGLQYLLSAWEEINLPDAELMVGGSTMTPGVQNLIRTRFAHLSKVNFMGYVNDLNAYYHNCSIYVCPSRIDGHPRTVYEAMACGLPIIVTDGCGARDFIRDGKEGFVVPNGDAGAIAQKIKWFYDHPEEIPRMGQIARETVSRFPKEGFAAQVGEAILTLPELGPPFGAAKGMRSRRNEPSP